MKSRWTLAICGGLLVLVALQSHRLGLSASPGMSMGKVLLFSAGLVSLGAGILGRRLVALYSSAATILLNTIVLLVLVESSLFVVGAIKSLTKKETNGSSPAQPGFDADRPSEVSYYRDQEWSEQYFMEYERAWNAAPLPYRPYVIWRNRPFKGETLNITEEGWRRTPGSDCTPESYTIFMLGGSTLWGTGVPDWGTIPAHVQAALSRGYGRPVCVVNLSEQAYVSTQSVIQLVLELRAGRIPDLVVFYDGINDVFAAYQSGMAGVHQNLARVAARFEQREEVPPLVQLLARTRTFKAAFKLSTGREYGGTSPESMGGDVDAAALASEVVSVYAGNERIVDALGAQWGFEHVFFWQPVLILDKKRRHDEESAMRELTVSVHPGIESFFRQAYREAEELSLRHPRIHYLADVFQDEPELVYVDPWHVTLEGNQKIAREIVRRIEPIFEQAGYRSPPGSSE